MSADTADDWSIEVRPLEEADLPAVCRWLATPHVRAWWRDPSDPEAVRAKYLPRIRGDEPTEVFVVECEGRSIGLIQRYRFGGDGSATATITDAGLSFPNAAGIDYLIGEASLVGRGLGRRVVEQFSRRLFDDLPDVETIVVTPQAGNLASRRVLERCGYVHVWTGSLESDDAGPAAIHVRHRPAAD